MTALLVEQKLPLKRQVKARLHSLDDGRSVACGAIGELDDEVVRRFRTVWTGWLRARSGPAENTVCRPSDSCSETRD